MNSSTWDFARTSSSAHLQFEHYRSSQSNREKELFQKEHCEQRQGLEDNLIQSNTIQNQFTILSNQRDIFIRKRDDAEKELNQIQEEHQRIKTEHAAQIRSNLHAKEELGQKIEKLAMLKKEESRLRKLTENEFHAIQDCTKHSKTLGQKKIDATKCYIAEIDPLNSELAALLERRIEKKSERYITIRSVENVILPELNKTLLENNKPQLMSVRDSLNESIEFLKSVSEGHKSCVALLAKLRGEQHESSIELNAESWANTGSLEDYKCKLSPHIDLFYESTQGD